MKNNNKTKSVFLNTFTYCMFVVLISFILSIFIIIIGNDALGLVKENKKVTMYIPENASTSYVLKALKKDDIIKSKIAFRSFMLMTGKKGKYNYGVYELNRNMGYAEILTKLQNKTRVRDVVRITIPEGKELKEILSLLDSQGVCSEKSMQSYLDTFDISKYKFLSSVNKDRENVFEGYFFPDTYDFYKNETSENVVAKFFDNFDKKWVAAFSTRAKELNMSVDQVITLASIIEREAANDADRGKVASVFWNRLKNPDKFPYLQSCATVQYVLGERKAVLSTKDIKINSNYNTYLQKGLPIGPIASPGVKSIEAALVPDDTDYYFFVVNKNGTHTFSKTLEEHNKAVKEANLSGGTGTVN